MKNFLLLCIGLALFTACKEDDAPSSPALKGQTNRTVLAYVFQDTNLWDELTTNINDMERGWNPAIDGTMLVFVDASTKLTQFDGKPVLLEIHHDTTNLIVSKIIKTYEDRDATRGDVFKQVQEDAFRLYPADSYGLIMSGHGNGFMVNNPATRGMNGSDRWGKKGIDVDVIANNLAVHYDFLIFDACLMAETATLYQLRNEVDFVVASVELSPGDGFGYRSDLKALFAQPKADLYSFVKGTNDYFNSAKGRVDIDPNNYQTIGVYRMAAMGKLAEVTKRVLEKLDLKYADLRAELMKIVANPELKISSSMYYPQDQQYDGTYYYDMGLLKQKLIEMKEENLAMEFYVAIHNVVLQKLFVFSDIFKQNNPNYERMTANLSFYIPGTTKKYQDEAFYNRFEWSSAIGFTNKWE